MKSVVPIVVWIPMLDADELPAAVEGSEIFRGTPATQFWDGEKKLGAEVARSLDASAWKAWDVYLFYPPGAEWTDQGLPAPEGALAQAGGVVVGTKGTLPAVGDGSRVLPALRGRMDVVGEQEDLAALVARVAEPFARSHVSPRKR
jgi:hypothetical protein